jgi:hypothetical protein
MQRGSTGPATSLDIIPSLCVSERYDSNIFFAPPTPGLQRDDYVTNVSPMVRVNLNADYASGFLNVAGFSETYVKNPDVNFFGSTGTLSLNLDKSVRKILPAAGLTIDDTFSYTPLPPGFVNPTAGTSPDAPTNIQSVYARGVLAFRTNNVTNTGIVSTSYAVTGSTSISAAYYNAIIRFGTPPGGTTSGGGLFDTTTQSATIGVVSKLSGVDTLNIRNSYMLTEFTQSSDSASSSSSPSFNFRTNTATVGWSRVLTPNFTVEVGGGGIVIDPGITTYAANASLIMVFQDNSATLSYSRSAFPSFFSTPIVVVGDVFSLSAIQKIARDWQFNETANYSHSSGGSGLESVSFDSYAVSADIYYWITQSWSAALSYDYTNYTSEFGTGNFAFDRHVLTFSVRAIWR